MIKFKMLTICSVRLLVFSTSVFRRVAFCTCLSRLADPTSVLAVALLFRRTFEATRRIDVERSEYDEIQSLFYWKCC